MNIPTKQILAQKKRKILGKVLECKRCIKSSDIPNSFKDNRYMSKYKEVLYNVQSSLTHSRSKEGKNQAAFQNSTLQHSLYRKNSQSVLRPTAIRKIDITSVLDNSKVVEPTTLSSRITESTPHTLEQLGAFHERSSSRWLGISRLVELVNSWQHFKKYKRLLSVIQSSLVPKTSKEQENGSYSENNRLQHILNNKLFPKSILSAIALHKVGETVMPEAGKIVEPIPEPPPIPDLTSQVVDQLNALGEPTFASLGLGGWTPIGLVQNSFEYLHATLGVPWWGAIVIGTIVIRVCMFPLVVVAQRNAAKMNNYLPQIQVIQLKMSEARRCGNQLEVARYSQELMLFMKEKNLNPFKNMLVPLAQMPIFISFFMGLRQMANVPVDSLRNGGLFWFTDLTVPDQYFALPIITSFTLWATIEIGTDSARLSAQNMQTMKYVLRALPLFIIPFTVNFPGAILCYWVSSNFISLLQVGFLKIPAVREYFRIEALLKHNPENLPIKSKGFVGGIKESWTNLKISRELEERRRLDELQFQRAGKGPVVKTYKYDPTKQASNPKAISAKER